MLDTNRPNAVISYLPLTWTSCFHYYGLVENDEASKKMKVIYKALVNLFIENNASLNNLYMVIDCFYLTPLDKVYYDIYDTMLNNPNFISKIIYFGLYDYSSQLSNYKSLEVFLSSLPSSIKHINLFTFNVEVEKYLAKTVVQSQSQLSSITFRFPKRNQFDTLKHLSSTLTSIISFESCQFSNTMRFDALSYLTQLESLQFKNCNGLSLKVIQPLLNITTPLKIKTFVIVDETIKEGNTCEIFTPIQLLIQKIGLYIENLVLSIFDDELRNSLFNIIIDSCEKIRYLHLSDIDVMNISQLSKIIFKFNNYLK
jgi:hypothetical protein